jgi:hypothetical protein
VSIGNDLTVGNVVTISGTSQVLNVYSGSAFINTATLIDTTVTNTSISNAVIGVADIKSVDIKPITLGQTSKTNLAYLLVIKTNKKKYQIESERARGQAYDEVDLHRLYIWIQEKRTK